MWLRPIALVLVVVAASACSSSASHDPAGGTHESNDPPVVSSDAVWEDGKVIDTPTTIAAGTTVTIASGATIHVVEGITISVEGTLKSAAGAKAKITGDTWQGIVVAPGGTLALDGVDVENATVALDIETQNASAKYDNGTITNALTPFFVAAKGELSMAHSKVVTPRGTSRVRGAFTASYLDYDSNGFDGITSEHDDATITVDDSDLHGAGGTADMIVSYTGAGNIHVSHTRIQKVHCAFHLERVTSLDVSFVSAEQNLYGVMMHGSLSSGTKVFKSSNFASNYAYGIHEDDGSVNGPVRFEGCYVAKNGVEDVHLHPSSAIEVVGQVTSPVGGAQPR